jgi:Protein of unknown function (DUF3489)
MTAHTPTTEKTRRGRRRTRAALPVPTAAGSPSKLDAIVALLARPDGASLAELVAATGWQAHSVRGALAGSLKRKGHAIVSEKVAGERRYRIGAGQ